MTFRKKGLFHLTRLAGHAILFSSELDAHQRIAVEEREQLMCCRRERETWAIYPLLYSEPFPIDVWLILDVETTLRFDEKFVKYCHTFRKNVWFFFAYNHLECFCFELENHRYWQFSITCFLLYTENHAC